MKKPFGTKSNGSSYGLPFFCVPRFARAICSYSLYSEIRWKATFFGIGIFNRIESDTVGYRTIFK
ncbi:MAG TPA: hypothetical protein H9675_02260 [Firmicutes bacterium]|nr:hypothetical protein [Bacillota bacterium]